MPTAQRSARCIPSTASLPSLRSCSAATSSTASAPAAPPDLPVLYLGRIVFGMGSETMIVAQSAILARWFTGKELALSFGISLTISRLGTLFSFNTEALLAERMGYRGALWVAAALCLVSLACNWIYVLLDRSAEPVLHLREAGAGDK